MFNWVFSGDRISGFFKDDLREALACFGFNVGKLYVEIETALESWGDRGLLYIKGGKYYSVNR